MNLEIHAVKMDVPDNANVILGQTHFIKSAEDLYEVVATGVPRARFGIAFNEASGPCLIRTEGNDEELIEACVKNLHAIGAGHTFMILLREAYPINVLNQIKACPEVCTVFCATANPLEVIVASTPTGWGILGVIDGAPPARVETDEEKEVRRQLLRDIGYKC